MNEQLQRVDAAVAREWLAAIVDSSDDAIVSKTLDVVSQSWNKAAERIFGFTAQEAIGKSITIIIPEERLHEETMILRWIRQGRKVDHSHTIRRCKDGNAGAHLRNGVTQRDADGTIVGASKVARDISLKVAVEAEKRETERLRAHLAAIVQSSDDAIVSKDLSGTILSWNTGAERIFGYKAEEAVGKKHKDDSVDPADVSLRTRWSSES